MLTFTALQMVRGRVALAACIAFALGLFNEAFEFASALRFHDTYVGGFENTYWDVVFNSVGIAGASLWVYLTAETSPSRQGIEESALQPG